MNGITSRAAPRADMPAHLRAGFTRLAALDPDRLLQSIDLLCSLSCMANPIILIPTRNADGSQGQSDLTLTPGMMLTTDAAGNLQLSPIPVVPAWRIDDFLLAATDIVGTTKTVTFSSPMPSADYVLDLDYNGLAGLVQVTAKTAAGFVVKVVNVVVGKMSYHAAQKV